MVADFYDGLAADYHLVYGDRWDDAVAHQGEVLDRLIERARPFCWVSNTLAAGVEVEYRRR